ncbi:hypothetical protein SAMN05216302_1003121 [Nitrosomonas aestuarii]|uniref:Uncharacterized protein n=1 Tax=Nitrosomonas aestuarii TaxID=52441 RepID=A0A1I3YCR3_9PROT|nr:hypothetical protein [Nitrosomonas aestuarii]SFK29159.1 hypothetical protein SAMN05216302_1003121 [Nitrosomonas aestuarii]
MLFYCEPIDGLPAAIAKDASSGLPLLTEQEAIFKIILTYLSLPYSVAEYGCGKKTSLIIKQLIEMKIPGWAIQRGMILERDMSPDALDQVDMHLRPHALRAHNPLAQLGDLLDPQLRKMLSNVVANVHPAQKTIQVGAYALHHEKVIQFVLARSHVFTVLKFWDQVHQRVVERVIDPTLEPAGPFVIEALREKLDASESLLFTAYLLGHFRLRPEYLTQAQRTEVSKKLGSPSRLQDIDLQAHNQLIRSLTGAEPGSIGDPDTWSYVNNFHNEDEQYRNEKLQLTGSGDEFHLHIPALIEARENHHHAISSIRTELDSLADKLQLAQILAGDAFWAEKELEALADCAITIVYFNSLQYLAEQIKNGEDLREHLRTVTANSPLRGIGVRQRRRIDKLGVLATRDDGHIDARALNVQFQKCALETIRQMNKVQLSVFIDQVGNIHGVRLNHTERNALSQKKLNIRNILRHSVNHCSHIDTVNDGGKFDGRLGVTGGIQTAELIADLEEYCDIKIADDDSMVRLAVTAFNNEEMTFTGEGVSMSGSAAVAGHARPESVHNMVNQDCERYGDKLIDCLAVLKIACEDGRINLAHELQGTGQDLINSCYNPTDFFTRHTFERHIEQGPVLDRAGIPIITVGTIMGIHQRDFFFDGLLAEPAALEMNCRLRELTQQTPFLNTRFTVGMIHPIGDSYCHANPGFALRCELEGEKNHAGATATADRRDPGVGIARLARIFRDWIVKNAGYFNELQSVIGDLDIQPGTNRNVIPGQAAVTLAIQAENFTPEFGEEILRILQAAAAGELTAQVPAGGEGITIGRIEPVSFVKNYAQVRLSLDMREANDSVMIKAQEAVDDIVRNLEESFAVKIRHEIKQHLQPSQLLDSGQVLLMERSYGGSHNPNEMEMMVDLTLGNLLAFTVMQDVLQRKDLTGVNLVNITENYMPAKWLSKMDRFVSGALHDTCNIAACVMQK